MKFRLLLLSVFAAPWPAVAWPESLPPLSDLDRFPSAELCDNQLAFLSARRTWLDGQRALFSDPMYAPWFDAATADCEDRRRPWVVLYDAQDWSRPPSADLDAWDERRGCTPEYCAKRARRSLAELRSLVGALEYDAGSMPTPMSAQFFRRAY